jgi:predicted RNA binding protein YcfA (HicA-like mRNA interferase family)
VDFPSLRATRVVALLRRQPLAYRITDQTGSHRKLSSENGYPDIAFSFHDGRTLSPGEVRDIFMEDVHLTEDQALEILDPKQARRKRVRAARVRERTQNEES